MNNKKNKVAIVGATGVVGRSILKVLQEKNIANMEYVLFATKKSAGIKIIFMEKEYTVKELTETSFDECFDYAIFSAGGETAKKYAPIAAKKGSIVIDNSSAFRMDNNVPLVVPEVNPEEAFKNSGIISNPNCSTIQAVIPLKALDEKYKIKRVVYSTYQAVSGAGRYGIEDLENKSKGEELKKFKYPIYNNCLPQIDLFMEDGYTKEEYKMINETRKILNRPNLPVTATAVRVPVINSHSESINIELENEFKIENIKKELAEYPGIIVIDNPENEEYPIATEATNKDDVFVGRIRRDDSVKNGLNIWVVADNIRKGAATNAIQIMELLIKRGEA